MGEDNKEEEDKNRKMEESGDEKEDEDEDREEEEEEDDDDDEDEDEDENENEDDEDEDDDLKESRMVEIQVKKLKICGENSLVAVATNLHTIVLIDYLSYTIVRELHCMCQVEIEKDGEDEEKIYEIAPSIEDFCFSRDGRRILSVHGDKTLQIFDLPTATLVDWVKFKSPATSITVSPSGEYICTTHQDRVGLALWNDRSFFHDIALGRKIEAPVLLEEPMIILDIDNKKSKNNSNSLLGEEHHVAEDKDED